MLCITLLWLSGAAPIPYVELAIFNFPHPYLRSTTVLLDGTLSFTSVYTVHIPVMHSSAHLLKTAIAVHTMYGAR